MEKLWTPSLARVDTAIITDFARVHGFAPSDYHRLWRWTIDRRDTFWRALWDYAKVIGEPGDRILVDGDRMPGARWFPDASLNYAQNLLERRPEDDPDDALVFWGEDKVRRRIAHAELKAAVSGVASALQAQGVKCGDRVAAYLPNMPETIIAMLGTAAIGAVWSSCSPDFGVQGVLDRFGQIEPTVVFAVD
ncbi:MAG TPA: AMP-binding protein, partial [Casimicrobiaceae bacterium]